MLHSPSIPLLLLLGQPPLPCPEPLASLLAQRRVALHAYPNLYTLAAEWVCTPARVAAILLDPAAVTPHEAPRLEAFTLRCAIPLVLLPASSARRTPKPIPSALPWNDVCWEHLSGAQPQALSPPLPPPSEFIVTDDARDRYDEAGMQPLLTDEEVRALLGAAD